METNEIYRYFPYIVSGVMVLFGLCCAACWYEGYKLKCNMRNRGRK